MTYEVVLHRSEEGYAVSCPALLGCWSQGETEEEALANVRVAIGEYLAVRDEIADGGRRAQSHTVYSPLPLAGEGGGSQAAG